MIATIDNLIPPRNRKMVRTLARQIDAAMAGFLRGHSLVCLCLGIWYGVCSMSVPKRCEELLIRLKSADPWAYWPFEPDERLHGIAPWAGHGYWQGFFEDADCRFPLVKRQWNGSGVASSVRAFGFHRLRENLVDGSLVEWRRSPFPRRASSRALPRIKPAFAGLLINL